MNKDIFSCIERSEYEDICNTLKDNEIRTIYTDEYIEIELKKGKRKIFTFVNTYGDENLNDVLNNVCKLV